MYMQSLGFRGFFFFLFERERETVEKKVSPSNSRAFSLRLSNSRTIRERGQIQRVVVVVLRRFCLRQSASRRRDFEGTRTKKMTTLMKTLTTVALPRSRQSRPQSRRRIFHRIFIIVFIDAKPPTHTQSGSSANPKELEAAVIGEQKRVGELVDGASNKGSPGQDSG